MNRYCPGALVLHGKIPHVVIAKLDSARVAIVPIRRYRPMQHRADVAMSPVAFPQGFPVGKRPRIACGYPVRCATTLLPEPAGYLNADAMPAILQSLENEARQQKRERRDETEQEHTRYARSNMMAERECG